MLLIYPPQAKPCEPPAGIAGLAGAMRGQGISCTLLDANLEAQLHLLGQPVSASDTWSRRATRNRAANLAALRQSATYGQPDRYRRAVADLNRLLNRQGQENGLDLSLANYQDPAHSPLASTDLLAAAEHPGANIFYPYFSRRLPELIDAEQPSLVGVSINYLSQALTGFAMLGFLRQRYPNLPLLAGGGLITSWLRNPGFRNPFGGLPRRGSAAGQAGPAGSKTWAGPRLFRPAAHRLSVTGPHPALCRLLGLLLEEVRLLPGDRRAQPLCGAAGKQGAGRSHRARPSPPAGPYPLPG